jgi:hypothetical protein
MANLLSVGGSSVAVGTIIRSVGPPDSTWLKCNGDVLLKADYPAYVDIVDELHPAIWRDWTFVDVDQSVESYAKYAISRMGSMIVLVGLNTTVWVSTDDGVSWNAYAALPSGTYYHYCLSNNGTRFVTARYNSALAYYSTDGQTWTSATLPSSTTWKHLSYFSNKFVLMQEYQSSAQYAFSTDGITWSGVNYPFSSGYIGGLANDGTRFLMYAYDYSAPFYKLYSSTDGQNWSSGTEDILLNMFNPEISTLAYLNSKWIMLGYEAYRIKVFEGSTLLDPDDWREYHLKPFLNQYYSYIYDNTTPIWTGEHYVIPNNYTGSILVGKSLTNLNYFKVNCVCNVRALMVNSGDSYIVSMPRNERSMARSTGVTYNKTTHFQLPSVIVDDHGGVFNYIKVAE